MVSASRTTVELLVELAQGSCYRSESVDQVNAGENRAEDGGRGGGKCVV